MTLDEIRIEIDAVDSQMKPLFIQRMACARHVAETKAQTGGAVFVPEREQAIIEKRTSDVEAEIHDEYAAFLKQMMSICRRYEYGLLNKMQEEVLEQALEAAGLDGNQEHQQIEIAFCCSRKNSSLHLFVNMASLNQIDVLSMSLETREEVQRIRMTLGGSIQESNMRTLLCQIGKEAEDFQILALK